MSKLTMKDLRKKTEKDLTKMADGLKSDCAEFHHKKMVKDQGKDTNTLGKIKKELARVLTVLNEKKSADIKGDE